VRLDRLLSLERDSIAQDVLFFGRLNPADYGLPTNTTRIQIITDSTLRRSRKYVGNLCIPRLNPTLREAMVSPDVIDDTLDFGRMVIGAGSAYTMPSVVETNGTEALVAKSFLQTSDGRYWLIESVPYNAIWRGLESLPDCRPSGGEQGAIRKGTLKDGARKHSQQNCIRAR